MRVAAGQQSCDPPLHLVVRAAQAVTVSGRTYRLIDEHNRIFDKEGRFLFLKFGAVPSKHHIEGLRQQIKKGTKTLLFVVTKEAGTFHGFSGVIKELYESKPPSSLIHLAPPYYEEIGATGSLWLLVSGPFKQCSLRGLKLASNHKDLVKLIATCRTSTILVHAE